LRFGAEGAAKEEEEEREEVKGFELEAVAKPLGEKEADKEAEEAG